MSVSSQIRDLVQTKLSGRKIDVTGFVDEMLDVIGRHELRCSALDDQRLLFTFGVEDCETELDAARGKLRMICARLAMLCDKTRGEASPYGGSGLIAHSRSHWALDFANTPDEQRFELHPVEILMPTSEAH